MNNNLSALFYWVNIPNEQFQRFYSKKKLVYEKL